MRKTTTQGAPPATVKLAAGKDAPEVLAEAIVDISQAAKRLAASRLKESTVLLLLSHSSKVGQRDVAKVLEAMKFLEATYLKPPLASKNK